MLPPLPEYDYLTHLRQKSFPVRYTPRYAIFRHSQATAQQYLDPLQSKSRRHLAFGLMRVFGAYLLRVPGVFRIAKCSCMMIGKQLCIVALVDFIMVSTLRTVSTHLTLQEHSGCRVVRSTYQCQPAPYVSILPAFRTGSCLSDSSGLDRYMETGGAGAQVRPWFWIALFFFGTATRDILIQWLDFKDVSSISPPLSLTCSADVDLYVTDSYQYPCASHHHGPRL